MSALLNGVVSPTRNVSSGSTTPIRLGPSGEIVPLHRELYEPARLGRIYTYHAVAAGVTPPKYDATSQVFGVWNQSTDKNLNLINLTISSVSGAGTLGNIGFVICNAGVAIGTPISAATLATAWRSDSLELVTPPAGKPMSAATVAAMAATAYRPIGLSMPDALAVNSTTINWDMIEREFHGEWIVPPGKAIFLCGNVAQATTVFVPSLTWEEVQIVG